MNIFLRLRKELKYNKEFYGIAVFLAIVAFILFVPMDKLVDTGQDNVCYQAGP
jgi:hypothetical protein